MDMTAEQRGGVSVHQEVLSNMRADLKARVHAHAARTSSGALSVALHRNTSSVAAGGDRVRSPDLEEVILPNWDASRRYAFDVIGGRWPEFEAAVAGSELEHDRTSVRALTSYAKRFMPGGWEAAEKHIATDPELAFEYARDVLKKPFPEGHPATQTIAASEVNDRYQALFNIPSSTGPRIGR